MVKNTNQLRVAKLRIKHLFFPQLFSMETGINNQRFTRTKSSGVFSALEYCSLYRTAQHRRC
jgi:hypothetical protein